MERARALGFLVVLAMVAGCGGNDEPSVMPNVVGDQLNLALDVLADAGVSNDDVEVVGGGTFGVVEESNWTVCAQSPSPGSAASDVQVIVDRECAGSAPDRDATTTSAPTTESPPTTLAPTTTEAPPPTAAPPTTEAGGIMPNVICANLQDAQDEIQRNGVFFSRSEDATGAGRSQVIDSNWQVVDQSPAPGTPIGEGEAILYVVKYGESSPC